MSTDLSPVPTNAEDQPALPGYDDGDTTEVSTSAFVHDPVLEKYQTEEYQDKWVEELEASRKERKEFVKKGNHILEHWADKRGSENSRNNYNLLYANTELKQAALYARTPSPDISRRFSDPNDQVSRVAALILQRKIETELDDDFDLTIDQIITDRVLPGIGIGWVRLEQCGGDDYLPYANQTVPEMGTEVFPDGHPQAGQPTGREVPTGNMVPHPLAQEVRQTPITEQCTPIDHVSWDDFYWSPCRTWKLCRWMGRHIPMSKQAIEDRFGQSCPPEVLSALSYAEKDDERTGDKADQTLRTKNATESTLSVYEIWDKELRMVWWIAEGATVPLDVVKDTNEFPGFFPTPTQPLGRFDGSNTIPHPDYHFVQDKYRQLDDMNDRATKMIQAAQMKFTYDASCGELKDLFSTANEFTGIPVKNWQQFKGERGGLANSFEMLPIQQLIEGAKVLGQAMEQVKQEILELEGLSGPFQAEAAHNETVIQTQSKNAFGTSRLSIVQKDTATYIQSLLRLKAHMICKFYTPEQLLQGTGTLSDADQKLVPQAIALLKNEQIRNFKLEVSVDSIQLPNWNLEKADKIEAFKAITMAIQQALPAVQQMPQMAPLVLKSISWLVSGFKEAQYLEGEIDTALQGLAQAAQSKQGQPPKPTPEQMKAQSHSERGQVDLQITQMQEDTKRQIADKDAQLDEMRLQIQEQSNKLKAAELAIKAKSAAHDKAMDLTNGDRPEPQPQAPAPHLTVAIGVPSHP